MSFYHCRTGEAEICRPLGPVLSQLTSPVVTNFHLCRKDQHPSLTELPCCSPADKVEPSLQSAQQIHHWSIVQPVHQKLRESRELLEGCWCNGDLGLSSSGHGNQRPWRRALDICSFLVFELWALESVDCSDRVTDFYCLQKTCKQRQQKPHHNLF